MRSLRIALGLMATGMFAALWACAQAPSPTQSTPQAVPQTAERTVLDFGPPDPKTLTFDTIAAQLPRRIAAADAARLLVRIDLSHVAQTPPHFGVLDFASGSSRTSGKYQPSPSPSPRNERTSGYGNARDERGNVTSYGLVYPFDTVYSNAYYYPYGNYYVPYYSNGSYYTPYNYYNYGLVTSASYPYTYTTSYPYTFAYNNYGLTPTASTMSYNVGLTYPFLYNYGNTYYPYTFTGVSPVQPVTNVSAYGPVNTLNTVTAMSAPVTQNVTITEFHFSPATVTVPVGSTITWLNAGRMPHTSTSDVYSLGQWDSGVIQPGGSYSVRLSNAGTYTYHCKIHPNMVGTIVVQ